MAAAVQPQEKFAIYSALKLPENCYIINIGSPTHHKYIPCLKENPHNLAKYESKETSKNPISQLFSELEKI